MRAPSTLAALAILAAACGNPRQVAPPAAFDRPQDVAFFCWDLNAGDVRALEDCAPTDAEDGQPVEGRALHALVTQTTTGELAAVRITGDVGEPGVIDTDVRIPGFTFAAVGEVPSAVAVDAINPQQAYVTSRGSGALDSVGVRSLRRDERTGAEVTPFGGLPTGARPSDMVLAGGQLFIALPGEGQVLRVTLDAEGLPDETTVATLDLSTVVPDPINLTMLDPSELPAPYLYTCPDSLVRFSPPVVAPRMPESRDLTPEPWSFALDDEDPDNPVLLVADRALPIIHTIDVNSFVEGPPISVSVPTRELALTPRVPATVGAGATERYLYAVDELDRSVLVVDYNEANPTFGAVLSANVVEPFDRLAVPFLARAIEVVTPTYDPAAITTCADAAGGDDASPTDLRGVFLAVASSEGRVRFYDIVDLDTACRGIECGTAINLAADDQIVAIGRHRPRVGSLLDEGVRVDPEPQWETGAGAVTVRADGTNGSPGLAPLMTPLTCDEPLDRVYPSSDDGQAIVCAVADPWAATNQTWTATYEGELPFTGSTGAILRAATADTLTLESRTDYCARGVIGEQDTPADGYLSDYTGDQLVITADLPPSVLMGGDEARLDRCEEILERTVGGTIEPLRLPILRAEVRPEIDPLPDSYVGRLTLGPPLNSDATLEEVRDCYPELVEVEVRTRGAFVVRSTIRPGFVHPVVRGATGSCEVDPALVDQNQRGRAFFDEVFQAPQVAFALGPEPAMLVQPSLSFVVTRVPTPLGVDVSSIGGSNSASLLTRLEYNEVDQRLYVVDQAVQGLLRMRLTNLNIQQTFR